MCVNTEVEKCEGEENEGLILVVLTCDKLIKTFVMPFSYHRNPPSFKKGFPRNIASKGKEILEKLNVTQQRAVLKTLMAEHYSLLKGYPGTGMAALVQKVNVIHTCQSFVYCIRFIYSPVVIEIQV